jgi:hypothetical protein
MRKIVVFVNFPSITTGRLLAFEAWEHPEEKISYAGEAEREYPRKGGVIRAVLASNGDDRERYVYNDAYADPGGHDLENSAIDAIQEGGKTGKEDEKGDMEQQW